MQNALEHAIAELKARQDIHDVLARYCRGADLCDVDMMRSCYHPGAIDDHGFFNGPADVFAESAAGNLRTLFSSTRHVMTNEYVELDGDAATSETYILCFLRIRNEEGLFDVTARCRYLDRFECRDGAWKIVHRQLVSDGSRLDRVEEEYPRIDQGAPGARGASDPSVAFFARYGRGQPTPSDG